MARTFFFYLRFRSESRDGQEISYTARQLHLYFQKGVSCPEWDRRAVPNQIRFCWLDPKYQASLNLGVQTEDTSIEQTKRQLQSCFPEVIEVGVFYPQELPPDCQVETPRFPAEHLPAAA